MGKYKKKGLDADLKCWLMVVWGRKKKGKDWELDVVESDPLTYLSPASDILMSQRALTASRPGCTVLL